MKSLIIKILWLVVAFSLMIGGVAIINRFTQLSDVVVKHELNGDDFINYDFSAPVNLGYSSDYLTAAVSEGALKFIRISSDESPSIYLVPIALTKDGSAVSLKNIKRLAFEFDYYAHTGEDIYVAFNYGGIGVGFDYYDDYSNSDGIEIYGLIHEGAGETSPSETKIYYDDDKWVAHMPRDIYNGDDWVGYQPLHCKAILNVEDSSVSWYVDDELICSFDSVVSADAVLYRAILTIDFHSFDEYFKIDNLKAYTLD